MSSIDEHGVVARGSIVGRNKVVAPGIPAGVVARTRLDDICSSLLERHHVVAFVAAAGFGKTVQAQLYAMAAEDQLVWLSVDPADASPSRFLTALATALDPFAARASDEVQAALREGHTGEEAAAILADLIGDDRLLLVFDECETILEADETMSVLDGFLDCLPINVQVLLLSRRSFRGPLGRRLVEQRMAVISEDDLRFTHEEALKIVPTGEEHEARRVRLETGGWIAGAVFSNERRGDQGYKSMDLSAYLRSEIMDRLEPDVCSFLLDTSVLRLVTPEAAAALVGPGARGLLERIRQGRLPAVTYREGSILYHSVLRSFLHGELLATDPVRETELQGRRAAYLLSRGYADDATELFLALGRLDEALVAAEAALPILYNRGDWVTLQRWLDAFGEEAVRERPLLLAAQIRSLYGLRRFDSVDALIRHLDRFGLLRAATEADKGLLATAAWALQIDPVEAKRLLAKYAGDYRADAVRFMLEVMTGVDPVAPPQISDWNDLDRPMTWGLVLQGRFTDLARLIPMPADGRLINPNPLVGLAWRGEIREARAELEQMPDEIRERPHTRFVEACIALTEGNDERCLDLLQLAITESRKTAFPLHPDYEILAAYVMIRRGDDGDAVLTLERWLGQLSDVGKLALEEWVQAFLGFAYLRQGRVTEARSMLQECVRSMSRAHRRMLLPLAAVCLAEAEAREGGDPERAHVAATTAYHASVLSGSYFWLLQGLDAFPDVRDREMARDASDSRWRRIVVAPSASPLGRDPVVVRERQKLIEVQPFGSGRDLIIDGEPCRIGRVRVIELAAYLALHPAGVERAELQRQLFPDSDQRRGGNHFRQIAHKLREATGVSLARSDGGLLTWPDDVAVDSLDVRFERLLSGSSAAAGEERLDRLQEAMSLVSGGYLEQSDLLWAEERRYHLDVVREEALLELAELMIELGQAGGVREHCESMLELNPYSEPAYRLLLRAEQQVGSESSCLAIYRRAVDALRELGLEPDDEMRALVSQ